MAGDSKEVARGHLADAGVEELPDDWDVVTLGDLFTEDRGIAVGVMYPGDHDPDGVPLIKAGDLNGSIINPQPDFRISKDKHHEYRRTALEGGELLMTLVGNVGQCAVVPERMAGWNTARAVAVMRLNEPSETHFIQQCLLSRPLQHLMDVWCNTTVQATLNLKEIRQLPLPWPPKKSRDAIAAFGKALDDKIELNRQMNETLEAMARALFQSWFVDFDPVRAKLDGRQPTALDPATAALFPDHLEDSSLGYIPKGWKACPLAELIEVVKGRSYRSEELAESKTALVTLKSFLRGGGYRADGLKPFTGEHKPSQRVRAGDLVVAFTDVTQAADVIGKPALVRSDDRFETLVASLDVGIVRPKSKHVSIPFLYCLFLTAEFQAHTYSHATGTTVLHLGATAIPSFVSVVPTIEIAEKFAERSDSIFRLIDENAKQSRTLATLRDTLLPKLLSGELRIANSES
jgi:type I restriction enzyme, S subunit